MVEGHSELKLRKGESLSYVWLWYYQISLIISCVRLERKENLSVIWYNTKFYSHFNRPLVLILFFFQTFRFLWISMMSVTVTKRWRAGHRKTTEILQIQADLGNLSWDSTQNSSVRCKCSPVRSGLTRVSSLFWVDPASVNVTQQTLNWFIRLLGPRVKGHNTSQEVRVYFVDATSDRCWWCAAIVRKGMMFCSCLKDIHSFQSWVRIQNQQVSSEVSSLFVCVCVCDKLEAPSLIFRAPSSHVS